MAATLFSSLPPPLDYPCDWSKIARLIIGQSLRVQPGERVIIHADPTYFPALLEQVRIEIVRAGAVELCTAMLHSSGLEAVRLGLRRREDAALKEMEDRAMEELFALADIYIWLPTRWDWNVGQTEKILETWQGRSIHFHWVIEPNDDDLFRRLSEMYQEALFIDYQALTAYQERLISILRSSTVRISDPAGTDLTFRLSNAHFHRGNGDASKEFIAAHSRPGSARDREVELPAGAIRTIDVTDAQGTLVCTGETFGGRPVGALTYRFEDNRIVEVESQYHNDYVQAMWELATGDKDRIGEVNLGVNPVLKGLPGLDKVIPYFGYGEGVIRISLGDNKESGGTYSSSYQHWLFLTGATLEADGRLLVESGALVRL